MKNAPQDASNLIGQRLKSEMKKRGINSTELAKRADVKTSFIYDIISGKSTNPSTVKLARVVDSLGISLSYLVDGSSYNEQPHLSGDYISVPNLVAETSGSTMSAVSVHAKNEPLLFHKSWAEEYLKVAPLNLRMLTLRGDSMEPTFMHNDLILVDISQVMPSPPGFFALFDGFGLAVKRLEFVESSSQTPLIRVISDNPHYSVYERSAADISIIGRVVWFSREI